MAALALAVGAGMIAPAQAAATPTLTISGGNGVFGIGAVTVNGTASAPGAVKFTANGAVIVGCEAVATSKEAPYVAKCSWTPGASGPTKLGGTFTPTDSVAFTTAEAPVLTVNVGVPVQTTANNPIQIYVDTILATGSTGAIAPRFQGCAIMNEFMVGQTIVFRVYANNADQGNAVMDSTNTEKAYVEVAGLSAPIPLSYGNHSGVAFWTGVLKTGPGNYNTLGEIAYKVVMVAKDSSTMKVLSTKLVARVVNGARVKDANGNTIYDRVSYYRTVKIDPILKGATGVFESKFAPQSRLTLYAVPAAK